MDIFTSLAIIAFAALIHASFQLSVGVLTLLSGHALGAQKSRARLLRLTTGYMFGVTVMTVLLISFISLLALHFFSEGIPLVVWAIASGLMLGIGIAVWLFYYRKGSAGVELWIPRSFAKHLNDRSKATHYGAEAFSLGLTTVIAEIIFIAAPLVVSALVLLSLPNMWQLVGIGIYTVVSLLGLLIAASYIGSGHSLAHVQRWRVANKRFLQIAGGGALVVLGFFVYTSTIVATVTGSI